jgi:hypothetical protein
MGEIAAGDRPEWRPRKPRKGEGSRARAAPTFQAALPSPAEMRNVALRVLLDIAQDPEAPPASRVGAAGRLLEASPAAIRVPGWVPTATDSEPEPASPEDDPSWT